MSYIAECDQCGVIERGEREDVSDALEDHEQWHDVRVKRAATDGGDTDASQLRGSDEMPRVTVRVPPQMLNQLDTLVERGIYANRSEGIRDALRERLVATDGGGYECALCGTRHASTGVAAECCSRRFDDRDLRTDGGRWGRDDVRSRAWLYSDATVDVQEVR